MSTLEFPYPRSWKTTVQYTLARVDDSTAEDHLVFADVDLLKEGHNSATYVGNLLRGGERIASVVCKVAYTKRNLKMLRHEASLYRGPLQELQGEVLPRFYGLYEGQMEDEELTGCLITQYTGQHRKEPLHGLPWEMRMNLIMSLVDIHEAGVVHGDFTDRNVVFTKTGFPCILDFGHAESGHKCGRKMEIVFHAPWPNKEEFGCDELYEACRTLSVWTPPYITYLYQYFPVEYAQDPEKLASCAPKDMPREHALSEARASIYEFAERWNKRLMCEWN